MAGGGMLTFPNSAVLLMVALVLILLLVALVLILLLAQGSPLRRFLAALMKRWRRSPKVSAPVEPRTAPLHDLTPLFGNIAPIPGETEPDVTGCDVFPVPLAPYTRYEEFNWRLILFDPDAPQASAWPHRTFNDFPLTYRGRPEAMLAEVRRGLRPRYPVIIDWDGLWHRASAGLERTPDLRLPLLDAYLGLPPEDRPVVVSRVTKADTPRTGILTCMRYGFVDYRFPLDALPPYPMDGLMHLFQALTGPAETWLWFSVARLRHDVLGANREAEALRSKLEEEATRDAEIRHENRFATLWGLRQPPAEPEPVATPSSEESGQPA